MGHFEPFSKKYGLSGSVISAASLINGIGTAIGLERVHVQGITGSQDSNIPGKILAAIHELESRILFWSISRERTSPGMTDWQSRNEILLQKQMLLLPPY